MNNTTNVKEETLLNDRTTLENKLIETQKKLNMVEKELKTYKAEQGIGELILDETLPTSMLGNKTGLQSFNTYLKVYEDSDDAEKKSWAITHMIAVLQYQYKYYGDRSKTARYNAMQYIKQNIDSTIDVSLAKEKAEKEKLKYGGV